MNILHKLNVISGKLKQRGYEKYSSELNKISEMVKGIDGLQYHWQAKSGTTDGKITWKGSLRPTQEEAHKDLEKALEQNIIKGISFYGVFPIERSKEFFDPGRDSHKTVSIW